MTTYAELLASLRPQEKTAAVELAEKIQSGEIDVDQLTEEQLLKVAQILDGAPQEASQETTKKASQEALEKEAAEQFLQTHDLAGRVQARAFDDELTKIAAEKQLASIPMTAEEKLAAAQIRKALESGELKADQIPQEKVAAVETLLLREKLAAEKTATQTGSMGSFPTPETYNPSDKDADTVLKKIMDAIGGAAGKVDAGAQWLGGLTGAEKPWLKRLIGYGGPGAALAGGGLTLAHLLGGGGNGEGQVHEASAKMTLVEKMASAAMGEALKKGSLDFSKLSAADLQMMDGLFLKELMEKSAGPKELASLLAEHVPGMSPEEAADIVSGHTAGPFSQIGSALGGAGKKVMEGAGWLGSKLTGGHGPSWLQKGVGVAAPTAAAAGLEELLRRSLGKGNADQGMEATASAQVSDFDQEAVKVAQAILTTSGVNPGTTKYDPQAVTTRAYELLKEAGWSINK